MVHIMLILVAVDNSLHKLLQVSAVCQTMDIEPYKSLTTESSIELSKICQVFPNILPLLLCSIRRLAENVGEQAPFHELVLKIFKMSSIFSPPGSDRKRELSSGVPLLRPKRPAVRLASQLDLRRDGKLPKRKHKIVSHNYLYASPSFLSEDLIRCLFWSIFCVC